MRWNVVRRVVPVAALFVACALGMGAAGAVTISDCNDAGGMVVRCSTRPVTREDKTGSCPTPGRSVKIWCVGGFYGSPEPQEILDHGGDSRYQ